MLSRVVTGGLTENLMPEQTPDGGKACTYLGEEPSR